MAKPLVHRDRGPEMRHRRALAFLMYVAAMVFAAWVGSTLGQRWALADIADTAQRRIPVYASSLLNTVRRHDYLPVVLAHHPDILALLEDSLDDALRDRANRMLARVNHEARSAILYAIDAQGVVIASSNWQEPDSFVGDSYAIRRYFSDALANGSGRFYGVGMKTGIPGFFLAQRVEGPRVGVVVAKLDLSPLEKDWRVAKEAVFVSDAQGVIFLASRPEWRYHTLEPIDVDTRARIEATRQYGESQLNPIARVVEAPLPNYRYLTIIEGGAQSRMVDQSVALDDGSTSHYDGLMLHYDGWTLHYLTALDRVDRVQRYGAIAGLVIAHLIAAAALIWRLRRNARQVEREGHTLLEQRVAERTSELTDANARLATEIEERRRASNALQQKQGELVQAGKLVAIGQLSAAIVHEINQPLAALQIDVASTRVLLERGRLEEAKDSFRRVGELAKRMAAITQHLKIVARGGASGNWERVPLKDVVDGALHLLGVRLREADVVVLCDIDPEAGVAGEAIKLEQVFLNLIGNALDAMAGRPRRELRISAEACGQMWSIHISDTGGGIATEVGEHLFDPFVTTKPAGKGLGLGLSLSRSIIGELGGTIRVASSSGIGATLTVDLPMCMAAEPPGSPAEHA